LSDGVAPGEVAAREGLVDDAHLAALRGVFRSEAASGQDADADTLEVARRDDLVARAQLFLTRVLVSLGLEAAGRPRTAEGTVAGQPGALHTGDGEGALEDPALEGRQVSRLVPRSPWIDARDQ